MLLLDIDIINLYEIEQIDFEKKVELKLYYMKFKFKHKKVLLYDTT